MKLTFLRTSVLLALALGLTACGGGKATFVLGGPVTGLKYPGLVITNVTNGDAVTVAPPATAGNTSYALGKTVEYGETYNVQITSAPAHQTCVLSGGSDTAGRLASISIQVDCAIQSFSIGGTVTGLKETGTATLTGLVLGNGADRLAVEKNAAYVMPLQVPYAETYGVYVLTQPTGQTCTVSNASGTVNTVQLSVGFVDVVNNINVNCVNNP
jgi:hypothetical protein